MTECGIFGFGLVLSNYGVGQIGRGGSGLGLEGIPGQLSIEFDFNRDLSVNDPNAAHISVLKQDLRNELTSNHKFEVIRGSRVQHFNTSTPIEVGLLELNGNISIIVTVSNSIVLKGSIKLSDLNGFDLNKVNIGFTASSAISTSATTRGGSL